VKGAATQLMNANVNAHTAVRPFSAIAALEPKLQLVDNPPKLKNRFICVGDDET
jgi:hypothetical protein